MVLTTIAKRKFIPALIFLVMAFCGVNGQVVSAVIIPSTPLIEKDPYGQDLNFDISLTNNGEHALELCVIEVSVIDAGGKLVLKKSINRNGQSPGMEVLGAALLLKPGGTINVFNPFYHFAPDIPIAALQYDFFFQYADTHQQEENNKERTPVDFDTSITTLVRPEVYHTKTHFFLPLKGKIMIWDGHDFYSHHRRFPVGLPERKARGITANSNRYAYDFMSIDSMGNMYKGSPFRKQNWYIYGQPVYAPAAGTVIEVQNDIPDNEYAGRTIQSPNLPADMDPFGMGNHVIIDHGNGEFSVLLHMEKGSVPVRTGQAVKAGQLLGRVGFSGDAIFPHLHYTVMNGSKELVSEGIPSYFYNYKLFRGGLVIKVEKGRVDTGDIIESAN